MTTDCAVHATTSTTRSTTPGRALREPGRGWIPKTSPSTRTTYRTMRQGVKLIALPSVRRRLAGPSTPAVGQRLRVETTGFDDRRVL